MTTPTGPVSAAPQGDQWARIALCGFPLAVMAFVAGLLTLQHQPQLPDPSWGLALPLLLAGLWSRWLRLPAAFFIGLLWAALNAHWQLADGLEEALQGQDLRLEGVVSSFPEQHGRRLRFRLNAEHIWHAGTPIAGPRSLRLSCYGCQITPQPGERYRLTARLKRPTGFMNPSGFDYEGWLFQQGIHASGYVRSPESLQHLGAAGPEYTLLRLRYRIRQWIERQTDAPAAGMIAALAVGDRSGISRDQWEIYTRSGINHLVAISGLHIGIVIGLAYWLVQAGWKRSLKLLHLFPAQKAGIIGGLLAASGYAALAGFAIPTQRALIMALILLGGSLIGRSSRPTRNLALALLLVTLWDPLSVLSAGLWLSFGAVAAIFYVATGQLGRPGILSGWGRIQWVIALTLAPLLVARGLEVSLIGPLVNLLLVPLFSVVVIPLVLLGVALGGVADALGGPLIRLLAEWLTWIQDLLAQLTQHPWAAHRFPQVPVPVWLAAGFGVLWLLAPKGVAGRPLGLLWLLPLLLWRPAPPPLGEARISLLDVGQGLALVVQTHGHLLVYDAGPSYSADFNAGAAVVAPFLQGRGLTRIHRLVVTNGDADHAGGVAGLLAALPADLVLSGEPEKLTEFDARPCHAGMSWHWDGVTFALLHPDDSGRWRGNNASCVLKVSTPGASILLTGDIERAAERHLSTLDIAAKVVLVPHHGSTTSSSQPFVDRSAPAWALISAGYRNPYGFPKAAPLARWQQSGAEILTTADQGMIELNLTPQGVVGVSGFRQESARYWNRRPLSALP